MGVDGEGGKESEWEDERGESETSRGMVARLSYDVNTLYSLMSIRSNELWKTIESRKVKIPTHAAHEWGTRILHTHEARATFYDGVGSVKRHLEFTSREGLVFSSPKGNSPLSFISTKARFVNPAVESGSTNHLFGHLLPTMIRSSDAPITRGSKAPNQNLGELALTRVPPGLPCMRTSRA
jgi:hypothetical protein